MQVSKRVFLGLGLLVLAGFAFLYFHGEVTTTIVIENKSNSNILNGDLVLRGRHHAFGSVKVGGSTSVSASYRGETDFTLTVQFAGGQRLVQKLGYLDSSAGSTKETVEVTDRGMAVVREEAGSD
jgi:hypothetical protein